MQCPQCGSYVDDSAAFCQNCGAFVKTTRKKKPRENVFLGIIGAILGALVGGASIVLLSRLGFVAALSGILLVAGTVFGYEKLAGDFSVVGLIVSILLVLVVPYLAVQVDVAITIASELGMNFFEALGAIGDFTAFGLIDGDIVMEAVGQTYLYVLLGAVISGVQIIKSLRS